MLRKFKIFLTLLKNATIQTLNLMKICNLNMLIIGITNKNYETKYELY
jgi:hypothetical protein